MPRTSLAGLAALVLLTALAACGGGGGAGSPTTGMTPIEPIDPAPIPTTPAVDGTVRVANTGAIDPTAAFRAVNVPTADGFTVTRTAPSSPVVTFLPEPYADSPPAPADLDAMMARAAHLWTRRLTDGGTYDIRVLSGHPQSTLCRNGIACGGGPSGNRPGPGFIGLTDNFLTQGKNTNDGLSRLYFGVLLHEVGHALRYRDPISGYGHPNCVTNREQVMCAVAYSDSPIEPTEADLNGLRYRWSVGPATDHQDFGLWATVPAAAGLDGFGVNIRRTVTVQNPIASGEYITDSMRIETEVRGEAGPGPGPGMGTARWSGTFLGAHTGHFQPVTGDAELTADLDDLATISLGLSGLQRTDGSGAMHPLAAVSYELDQHGNTWVDTAGRADARFYAAGTDPAGAAAGTVNDTAHELAGAWGALRD